ncbi:glycosyltransferase family 39 protein [Candidatus Shapirobacteria bacterium]|nr:glycosyltransferase family 39 protein [Candidatus Shapirobacteria bacterium]
MKRLRIPLFLKRNGFIIFILTLAGFLRFYQIEEKASFLGEQGRDLLVAKDILSFEKLTLLGPPTSLSPNIHFGPFYHYFNAFWLVIFNFNPLGPAVGFGILSLLACFLLYLTAKNFGFKKAGFFSSLLFASSPLMVRYGQSMFNSYFLVSFSVFCLWALSKFWGKNQNFWLFLAGLFAGIAIQANFLAYGLLFSTLILFIFLKKDWFKRMLWFMGGILLGLLPYLVFELRHIFFNTKGFIVWLTQSGTSHTQVNFFQGLFEAFFKTFYYSLGSQNNFLTAVLLLLSLWFFVIFVRQKKKDALFKIIWIFWLVNLFLIRIYPGELLDHYLGVIYPFVFLWFGYLFAKLASFKGGFVFLLAFVFLVISQLSQFKFTTQSGLGMPWGWNMKLTKESAKIIAEDASGRFNVANLLDGDIRAYAYRYLISLSGKEPLGVEQYPQAEILYVITQGDEQGVLQYPVWEIYSLGPIKVEKSWIIKDDFKIFKMVKK